MVNKTFWEDLKSGKFAEMTKDAAPEHTICNADETYNIMKPIFGQEDGVTRMYGIFVNRKNKSKLIKTSFILLFIYATLFSYGKIKRSTALDNSKTLKIVLIQANIDQNVSSEC